MGEKIEVVEPSIKIEKLKREIVSELSQLLPNSLIELIGSMAVPILGKSEIDVMIISKNVDSDSQSLSTNDYKQGPILNAISYLSGQKNGIRIDLQVLSVGHKMIEVHRKILKKLKEDRKAREEYQEFKKSLSGLSKEEYKKRKSEWIKSNFLGN